MSFLEATKCSYIPITITGIKERFSPVYISHPNFTLVQDRVFDPCNPKLNEHPEVDPNTYVDKGVEKKVPVGGWTIQSVGLEFQGTIIIKCGRKLYQSSEMALKEVPKKTYRFGARCYLVVKQGATDMSDSNQAILMVPPCDDLISSNYHPLNWCRRRKF